MAWTAPRTWVTNEVVTAAIMNAHVRDNFLETSAATVTTAGDLAYADGNKSMGSRLAIGADNTYLVSTGSAPVWRATANQRQVESYTSTTKPTSFEPLNSAGWGGTNVTVSLTTGDLAEVHFGCRYMSADEAGGRVLMSYSVSGATTSAASANWGFEHASGSANDEHGGGRMDRAVLTAGSNTFTIEAQLVGGTANMTGTIVNPFLYVRSL